MQPEYQNWNFTTNRCQRCYWYIIIISLCTILYIRYLPRQISLLCQSLESSKYICQLKIENMSIHTKRGRERERESEMIKRKCSRHFTVYIKNIFSKLFIAVDTAKLCKNCMLCCVVVLRQNLAHTRHSWILG